MTNQSVWQLTKSLQTDTLITIKIGTDPRSTTINLHKALLLDLSHNKAFHKILEDKNFYDPIVNYLNLPDDYLMAWEYLLHWKLRGSVPDLQMPSSHHLILQYTHCWLLGEKYNIPKFQDLVMLELLRLLRTNAPGHDTLELALTTTKFESKLMQLMAEEAVEINLSEKDLINRVSGMLLKNDDGPERLVTILRSAIRAAAGNKVDRFGEGEVWKEYMLLGGPERHWIFDFKP